VCVSTIYHHERRRAARDASRSASGNTSWFDFGLAFSTVSRNGKVLPGRLLS
jgi:hypothetical protein